MEHPHVEVQVAGVDLEPCRELAVRQRLVGRAEHLQDLQPQRMAERLQLLAGRASAWSSVRGVVRWSGQSELPPRPRRDRPRPAPGRGASGWPARPARRRRRRPLHGVGLALAGRRGRRCAASGSSAASSSRGGRTAPARPAPRRAAVAHLRAAASRGRAMPCGRRPEPEQHEVERHAGQGMVVLVGRGRAELAADPVDRARPGPEAADQVLVREAVVRALVAGERTARRSTRARRRSSRARARRRLVGAAGVEPPVRTIGRRACACWASSEATSAAGSRRRRAQAAWRCSWRKGRDRWLPRRAGRRWRGRPTRRTARAARRSPRPRRPAPERGGELHEPEITREAPLDRPSPSSATTPTDHGPRPRSRSSRRATTWVGKLFRPSRSIPRQSGSAPRRAARRDRGCAAPPGEAAEVGGGRRGVQAVELLGAGPDDEPFDLARPAGLDELPGTARSRACATVAVRIGRRPRRRGSARPAGGRRRSGAGTRSGRPPGRARSARAPRPPRSRPRRESPRPAPGRPGRARAGPPTAIVHAAGRHAPPAWRRPAWRPDTRRE